VYRNNIHTRFWSFMIVGVLLLAFWSLSSAYSRGIGVGHLVTIGPANTKPTPAPERHAVSRNETTFEEVKGDISFSIVEPSYLPTGSALKTVFKTESVTDGEGVQLTYELPNGSTFSFLQSKPVEAVVVVVSEDNSSQKVDIHGYTGVIYTTNEDNPSQSDRIMQWTNGTMVFEINGSIPADEMISIARSIP
jgi:hypothetical protein